MVWSLVFRRYGLRIFDDPAQNATGNWIKVVQRLPIRIELDPKDLQAYPLQVGLSMVATIDTAGTTDHKP